MKVWSGWIVWLAALVITLSVMGYMGYESYKGQVAYKELKEDYVGVLAFGERVTLNSVYFSQSEYEPKKAITDAQAKEMARHQDHSVTYAWMFAGVGGGFLLLMVLMYWGHRDRRRIWALSILFVGMSSLVWGVVTPAMEIEGYLDNPTIPVATEALKENIADEVGWAGDWVAEGADWLLPDEVEIEGRIYFIYQNKSIINVVMLLWNQDNYFVAVSILLFSVIMPFLKIGLSMAFSLWPVLGRKRWYREAVGYIGKLSMVDVLVVAFFLAYLSIKNMNPGADTGATAFVGIYFFAGYVLLSIFSYFLIEKYIKTKLHGEVYTPESVPETTSSDPQ